MGQFRSCQAGGHPGNLHDPGIHNLRAANLLGVLLQCCMLVPQTLHQRGQELALVPHCILQKLVSDERNGPVHCAWQQAAPTHSPTLPQDSLVVLVGIELAVPAGECITALAEQHKGLVLVHIAVHGALTIP